MPFSVFFPDEGDPPYEGPQSAADHDMYAFTSPTESRPAPQLSQGELGIADRLNWDMDHNTQSSYTPAAYVRPWEAEGWGSGDVATTPPTRLQAAQEQVDAQPILAQRPGFLPGQRDYEYMPTQKEQRRERAANIATIARERGTNWQDIPLPGGSVRKAPEPTYGRWQDAKLPVRIQPVPDRGEGSDEGGKAPEPTSSNTPHQYGRTKEKDIIRGQSDPRYLPLPSNSREWGEDLRPGEVGLIGYEGPGNPRWERENPREVTIQPISRPRRRERAFDVRDTWRTPRSGRGIDTSATQKINKSRPSQNFLQDYGDRGTTRGTNLPPTRYDQRDHSLSGYSRGGEVERMYDEMRTPRSSTSNDSPWVMKNFGTVRDPRTGRESVIGGEHWWHRDDLDAWNRDRRN